MATMIREHASMLRYTYIACLVLSVALQPNSGQDCLTIKLYISHTTLQGSSEQVIGS
jgi:hypothetical protein